MNKNDKYFNIKTTDTRSGIAYARPKVSTANYSYATYDDKWQFDNGANDYTPPTEPLYKAELDQSVTTIGIFTTLKNLNAFGNYNRYTDKSGGTDYAGDDYIIDHLTGLGWCYTVLNNASYNWNAALTYIASATNAGFTDWRMPNMFEMNSVWSANAKVTIGSLTSHGSVIMNPLTSTSRYVSTQYLICVSHINGFTSLAKTTKSTAFRIMFCRNHYN